MNSLILKNKNNLFERLYKNEIFTEEMINALGYKTILQFFKAEEIDLYKFKDAILNQDEEYDTELFCNLSEKIIWINESYESVKYKKFNILFEKLGDKMVKYLGDDCAWIDIFDFSNLGVGCDMYFLKIPELINSKDKSIKEKSIRFERESKESLEKFTQRALDSITSYESEMERLINHEEKWENDVIVSIIDLLCKTLHAVNFEKLVKEKEKTNE